MKAKGLTPETSVLVVIDLQEKLLPRVLEPERVTANCILLVKLAQVMRIPVVVTTQYKKGLGDIVPEIRGVLPEVTLVDKVEFGCFTNERFVESLKALGVSRNTLILCGIESHICVTQTAQGALDGGYIVHIASDATSSRTQWNWRIGLNRMGVLGAVISSAEMIVYEILRRSNSAEFKAMLPYLRSPVS
ncbi:MAG: isochorismatase family protein [Deltaproteobacteria bacterium]|jgi:nicotinamidase-related amidase